MGSVENAQANISFPAAGLAGLKFEAYYSSRRLLPALWGEDGASRLAPLLQKAASVTATGCARIRNDTILGLFVA
jgi:hypothetical protein